MAHTGTSSEVQPITSEEYTARLQAQKQRKQLPAAVGLCPVHQEEFFFPLQLPLSSPLARCPVAGCDMFLTVYVRP